MLPEDGIVGFADFPALYVEVKGSHYRSPHEANGVAAYNEFEILRKSKPQSGQHAFKRIFGIIDAVYRGVSAFDPSQIQQRFPQVTERWTHAAKRSGRSK